MNLRKVKTGQRFFNHYLRELDLPEHLDSPGDLLPDLLLGDVAVRERLILNYVRLSLTIVSRYLFVLGSNSLSEDLSSAAILAVTKTIDDVQNQKILMYDNNLTGVVVEHIHRAISLTLEHIPLIRIPGSTKRTWKKNGKEVRSAPKCIPLKDASGSASFEAYMLQDDEWTPRQGWWKGGYKKPDLIESEIMECLSKVLGNETEREIAKLRQNFTNHKPMSDREIGERLGLSHTTIYLIRKGIAERLKKELCK